jgi:hypothetical protein
MKQLFMPLGLLALVIEFTGCTTVTIYQSPITKFQSAVNSADSGIRTYLLSVDDIVAKRHLYAKSVSTDEWTINDFTDGGISSQAIQVRLQALDTVSSYANALNSVAQSKDVSNLQQAAQVLGTNVNNLNTTLSTMANDSHPLNIQAPVTQLVTLVGTLVIEEAQKSATEKAITDGATNIDNILAQLAIDLPKFSSLVSVSEEGILVRKLDLYNEMKKSTTPKDMDNLISKLLIDYHNIQSLQTSGVGPLLTDMESAHKSLVTFAASKKTPKDVSDLAAQIDVFSSQVELFNNAISSIQKTITPK